MQGFIDLKMKPWKRRLVTRLLAIVPAIIVAGALGDRAAADLLVISQASAEAADRGPLPLGRGALGRAAASCGRIACSP